jgi:hypothetical protein
VFLILKLILLYPIFLKRIEAVWFDKRNANMFFPVINRKKQVFLVPWNKLLCFSLQKAELISYLVNFESPEIINRKCGRVDFLINLL